MSNGIKGLTEVQRDNHYTVSQKIKTPNSCPQLHQLFTVRLSRKFVTKSHFKLFSLRDSAVNLQQAHLEIFHHASNMSLHYLVKYECEKNGVNLNYVL